jgi:DNA-binding transcriptional LysR family regulator
VDVLARLDGAETELRMLSGEITGPLRIGLMPTFTRGMLAPVLSRFLAAHPNVTVSVIEAYSADLTEKVAEGRVDFAVVPRQAERDGIRARPLGTDREILVRRPGGAVPHLAPLRLADLGPLRLVLPGPGNARRDRIEAMIAAEGLPVDKIIDMDAMIATLDFVAASDFATILPETICGKDVEGGLRWLHPIIPALTVSYAVIEPARRALSPAAAAFLDRLGAEYAVSQQQWAARLAAAGA